MSTGKDPKTMPVTAEYEAGYERTFKTKSPERGRWVIHPKTGKLIPASEYRSENQEAKNAPVMVDRFMEGDRAPDGSDIGNRTRRREYMKRENVADFNDFKETTAKAKKARDEHYLNGGTQAEKKARREMLERVAYQRFKI